MDYLRELNNVIDFVKFEQNAPYIYSGLPVGSNKVEDLKDRSLRLGIVSNTPGWIIVELNKEWEFEEIEIGGFNGNSNAFASTNGANSAILTSKDKSNWITVGTIPSNYGSYSESKGCAAGEE